MGDDIVGPTNHEYSESTVRQRVPFYSEYSRTNVAGYALVPQQIQKIFAAISNTKIKLVLLNITHGESRLIETKHKAVNAKLPGTFVPTDENAAQAFLKTAGILRSFSACPWCGGRDIRNIRREKFRCPKCRYEWGWRKGSILEGTRISCRTFVNTVRLYADDVPVNDAAHRLGIAYNTTYDMYARIRNAIHPDAAKTIKSTNDTVNPDPKQPVIYGIRLEGDKIVMETVKTPDPALIASLPLPTMLRGNLIFIDAYGKKYQGFITYAPDRHGQDWIHIRSPHGFPWSPLAEFWSFVGKSWMSHRGISRDRIPVFLHELVQRYNNRDTDRFSDVMQRIAACTFPLTAPIRAVSTTEKNSVHTLKNNEDSRHER